MNKFLWIFSILLLALRSPAQSNEPVRLALISETDEASAASDILTAQLSGNPKIQLVERNEIEKVYREQGMSAVNRDDLKLGRIVGADGLLLLDVVRTPQATNLTARLIAVKPGVILTDGSFAWPLKDTPQWAESIAGYLDTFVPKLTLSVKDAIPISVVNLRSAISSAEGAEAEKQLKLLTIQRLSQERQFFILERQQMQLLSEEKELKADDSAFWNGSYLLEGVVDQNGYSENKVTINARLTPPRGGAPLLFEVSGSRTNFAEVINQLAAKVIELLKINPSVPEWNTADEAAQYFNEAKWALRWGSYVEAQAAADSAWALGKRDLECALVRVKSYMSEVTANAGGYEILEETYGPHGYDANGMPVGLPPSEAEVQSGIKEMLSQHPWGTTYKETQEDKNTKTVQYAFSGQPPDFKNIDRARHALELYYEFSRTSPENLLKVASVTSNWKNSDWYNLGIEDLAAASQILQNFNFFPDAQRPMDKLAELRALTRSVAEWISQSPSVHDSYFVGDRMVTHDELANTMEENPNIFRCEVNWGCFWQERPEDEIELYRELMSSPVFSYIHKDFWLRELQMPRLVACDENDQQRIPMVWNSFVQELNASTNTFLLLEGKAVEFADADTELKMAVAFTNLFNGIFEHSDALVNNNVEVLYLDWGVGDLVSAKTGNGVVTDTKESLNHLFYSAYLPKLETMAQGYGMLSVFERQKRYLKENRPFDFIEFAQLFSSRDYSKVQALEIAPLFATYKSNLVAQSQNASGMQKGQLMGAIAQVGFLENNVNRILNPPTPKLQQQAQAPKPTPIAKTVVIASVPTNTPEVVTNVIPVKKFLKIPLDSLYHLNDGEQLSSSSASITAHHWFEGKLLLDFRYSVSLELRDGKGVLMDARTVAGDAIGIFNPVTERWSIIDCPESDETSHMMSQNNFYHRSALLHGELFTCDEKQIKKYNFQNQQWNLLSISDGNNYELFAVNGHLYAANQNTIFEIVNDGKETHILASTRRQPPVSALDTQELGTPTLFEGPGHSLRVCTETYIFTWTGSDWREDSAAPPASFPPVISTDGVLFRTDGFNQPASVSHLATETNSIEFCLGQKAHSSEQETLKPLWKLPSELFLPNLPAAWHQSDLYLLADHSEIQEIVNDQHLVVQEKVVAKDGYNVTLLCFSPDLHLSQKLFLKFDAPDACPPVTGINPSSRQVFPAMPPAWMSFTTNFLFLGLEKPDNFMANGAERIGIGYQAGVWMIPVSELEPALTAQRQTQFAQKAQTVAAAGQARQALLAKYDRNHNGVVDSDEREEALDDPAFIESELDTIDTNHNGWLDPEELAYFDANKNKILEPKEQAGIEIAQRLLAERLLKKFDANGDGLLDRAEFNALFQSCFGAGARQMNTFSVPFPDDNHDGKIDLDELDSFLQQQTRRSLRPHQRQRAAFFNQMRMDASQPFDARQMFKAEVEFYWQNPGGGTNSPPFNNRIPFGAGFPPNGLQQNTPP